MGIYNNKKLTAEVSSMTREVDTPHRKVFREEIRTAIRDAIFAGTLKPGDRIIETYWARELGV